MAYEFDLKAEGILRPAETGERVQSKGLREWMRSEYGDELKSNRRARELRAENARRVRLARTLKATRVS